ncbi:MAG TPA: hypothetical protein VKP65_10770, partial [Rhodothermales bacterium]|nr:hypothetical protein [Rhodothermales bacterium]
MKRLILLVVLLLCSLPADLMAQQRTTQAALDALQPAARSRVARTDTLLSFRTQAVPGGRLDVDAGVLRSAYRISASAVSPSAAPETNARAVLAEVAPDFGWTTQAEALRLDAVRTTRNSTHLSFQQTFYGLPVHNRQVKVNLDGTGRPTMVLSGYAPHLKAMRSFDAQPRITAGAAEAEASRLVSSTGARTSTPDLVVYPSETPRLAWRLLAWPTDAPAEWEVLIDAHTGELIQLFDMSVAHVENGGMGEREKGGFSRADVRGPIDEGGDDVQAVQSKIENRPSNFADGAGLVFDPDPLTTA